jgi:hypothetical protein
MFQDIKDFLENKCSHVRYVQTEKMAVVFVNHNDLIVVMKNYTNGTLFRATVGSNNSIEREEGMIFTDVEIAKIWIESLLPQKVRNHILKSKVKVYKKVHSQSYTVAVNILNCSGYLKFLLERTIEQDVKPSSLMFNYKEKMIEYNKYNLENQHFEDEYLMTVQSI